jgi:hypothetical protein
MLSVLNICGELQVGNRPKTELPSPLYNTSDGKYYQWTPQMVDGELTGYWKEVTAPTSDTGGYMNVNGIWYQWTPTVVDGIVTGMWAEAQGTDRMLNCIDGKYYRWVLTIVDGEMTGYWEEAL